MRRLSTFITGMAVGAGLLFTALNYHLVRAREGFHLVPKLESTLADTYVDIRNFGPLDWAQHAPLAGALVKADRQELMQSAAGGALQTGLDRLLGPGRSAPGR